MRYGVFGAQLRAARLWLGGLVVGCVALCVVASGARAAWQKPVALLPIPLEAGSTVQPCTPSKDVCAVASGVNGSFRMTGPGTGVGLLAIPTAGAAAQDRGTTGVGIAVDTLLYGVSLNEGAWVLTPFGGEPVAWEESSGADVVDSSDIAPDRHGGAFGVYQLTPTGSSAGPSVWARRYAGGAWQDPVQLEGPLSEDVQLVSTVPRVTVLTDGDAVAVYQRLLRGAAWPMTFARAWDAGSWGPEQTVETEALAPQSLSLASTPDGSAIVAYALEQVDASGNVSSQLAMEQFNGASFGARIDGFWRGLTWNTQTLAGVGGTALTVSSGYDAGLWAQTLPGGTIQGAFAPAVAVAPGVGDGDEFFSLTGTVQSAELVWDQGGWRYGDLNPALRRVELASDSAGVWSAPQEIEGGLASPAPQSADGPDDIAGGNGVVVFTAGPLTIGDGYMINNQDVYAVSLSASGAAAPVAIDNGPGGIVHVVGADADAASGSAAALFTQLGPDGNIRLYGVADVPSAAAQLRPLHFGQALCTDAANMPVGCITSGLDPVAATLAPPTVLSDTSTVLGGTVRLTALTAPTPAADARVRMGVGRDVSATAGISEAGHLAAAPRTVQIALERQSGSPCSWWSARRSRFVPGGCHAPAFFTVTAKNGRWRLHTARLGAGAVVIWVRGITGSRAQHVFRLGANKRTLRIAKR